MDLISNDSLLSITVSPNETLLSMDQGPNETLLSMDLAPKETLLSMDLAPKETLLLMDLAPSRRSSISTSSSNNMQALQGVSVSVFSSLCMLYGPDSNRARRRAG